jgi:pilus assembly protein Flp/PilA
MNSLARLLADDGGATMAEYALVVSLVAVVCIVAVRTVGQNTSTLFQNFANSM